MTTTPSKRATKNDGFRAGTFNCCECGRRTRHTNCGNSNLCPQCDERTMIENGIADGGYEGADLDGAKARVKKLAREVVRLGGALRDSTGVQA